MTIYAGLFYILGVSVLASTVLAVTRRDLVHAVLYLVLSFFGSALLFYLLGAPLLAALEVIIYAGAIMVLFLFIVMMMRSEPNPAQRWPLSLLLPTVLLGCFYLVAGAFMVARNENGRVVLKPAMAAPARFGQYLFENHWMAVEIVSLLLLVALVGALYLGRASRRPGTPDEGEKR